MDVAPVGGALLRRPRYAAAALRGFTSAALARCGLTEADAALGAAIVIDADLCGVASHGIAHPPWRRGWRAGG